MIEAKEHAKAAHNRYKPGPVEMCIPMATGFEASPMSRSLTPADLLIITVHIVAPQSKKMLVNDAKVLETINMMLCFVTPLKSHS